MFDSDSKLRHLPFFEEIASLEENSEAWNAAAAGMVTLRLVDSWLESGASHASDDEWNFKSVCAAVNKVSERSPMQSLLTSVLVSIREGKPAVRAVIPALMAYAKALEWDAKWRLAGDVYQTLLAHLHPLEDSEASIEANIRLAVCYRTLNELDSAAAAYAASSEIGMAVGDLVGVLRARIGDASLARLRGNLPHASEILDDAIARAAGPAMQEVRARALNERSGVAILSGNYELGVKLAYDAMAQTKSQIERDRILNNIAVAFMQLGVYSAARDAFLVVSVTAQEQYMRWMATINLLDVASLSGSQVLFELHQRELAGANLDPHLRASFELAIGVGSQRLGDAENAAEHLQRAMALAAEHGLSQLLFDAERALQQSTSERKAPRSPAIRPETEAIVTAVRAMRESVGVG